MKTQKLLFIALIRNKLGTVIVVQTQCPEIRTTINKILSAPKT